MYLIPTHRPTRRAAVLLALALLYLLPAGCGRKGGAKDPDLVIFATGSIYGQLHTCG